MEHLHSRFPDWPPEGAWEKLRGEEASHLGQIDRGGDVGLVYADGNAMGGLVQQLDSCETTTIFSAVVDESIREACHHALGVIAAREIDAVRAGRMRPLPADILLLGGDDLLVLLPADRALRFTQLVCAEFERRTRARVDALVGKVQQFFTERLLDRRRGKRGMTISCGVAIAAQNFPFYLLLDLAEELLKSAKAGGSCDKDRTEHWAPAYVDFHKVAGSASHDLVAVRREDYRVGADGEPVHARTLRPYPLEGLDGLCRGAEQLRGAHFPRSKLNALFEAVLEPAPGRARRLVRELFGRCNRDQRRALWEAVGRLTPPDSEVSFPWYVSKVNPEEGRRSTAVADLIEALDLFPQEADS
jgi:CRISPR-associated protein Cmr2